MKKRGSIKVWLLILFLVAFILGWFCPIEGPFDFLYDKYASQPAHIQPHKKFPTKVAPVVVPVKEVFIDLNEDEEPEWYWIIPKPETEDN